MIRKLTFVAIAAAACCLSTGCAAMKSIEPLDRIVHELKPHRLWRFNRYSEPGREDAALFSVADPLPELEEPTLDAPAIQEVGIVHADSYEIAIQ